MSQEPITIEATIGALSKRGDTCRLVLDLTPATWKRLIKSDYDQGSMWVMLSGRQTAMDFEPPAEAGHSNGNGHKPKGPKGFGGCFFNEALGGYHCVEQPTQLLETPCAHYKNPDDDGSVASEAEKAILSEPTCGLFEGVWHCADLPGVRLDSACKHMQIPEPRRTWYGRRRINGVVVEGRDPCPQAWCGRRAPKEGESHECRAPRSYVSDDGEGAATREDEAEGATA